MGLLNRVGPVFCYLFLEQLLGLDQELTTPSRHPTQVAGASARQSPTAKTCSQCIRRAAYWKWSSQDSTGVAGSDLILCTMILPHSFCKVFNFITNRTCQCFNLALHECFLNMYPLFR